MGLTFHDAKRLWEAKLSGASFETILICSHLQLYLHPAELEALRQDHRTRSKRRLEVPLAGYTFGQFADAFWKEFLDAKTLETLDYSAYEGASIVHDLNAAIPESLYGRFDAVIEAGSLEHIFNFPMAIRNLMRMVKVGGSVFLTTAANNLCGHGFYQFSPELIYRIFSPENGFETTSVVLLEATYPSVEMTPMRAAYQVVDPMSVRSRVGLLSDRPMLMVVDAKKISEVEPFRSTPQQSDYVAAWENHNGPAHPAGNAASASLTTRVFRALPLAWQRRLEGRKFSSQYSVRNREFYRKLP